METSKRLEKCKSKQFSLFVNNMVLFICQVYCRQVIDPDTGLAALLLIFRPMHLLGHLGQSILLVPQLVEHSKINIGLCKWIIHQQGNHCIILYQYQIKAVEKLPKIPKWGIVVFSLRITEWWPSYEIVIKTGKRKAPILQCSFKVKTEKLGQNEKQVETHLSCRVHLRRVPSHATASRLRCSPLLCSTSLACTMFITVVIIIFIINITWEVLHCS